MTIMLTILLLVGLCHAQSFVSTKGTDFIVNGKPYRFVGTNCYYLIYQDHFMVDNVLETAAQQGFEVIRTWGYIDIGYQNGSDSADSNGPIKNGVYFQYWDPEQRKPVYNDTNLEMLDYVFYKAKQFGVRIVLTLTNNWSDFGGMDQYNIWRTLYEPGIKLYHDSFYNDTIIMGWYKAYFSHLANRVNTYTNVAYKDDDTLFAWELANEPRCQGTGKFPSSQTCTLNYAKYYVQPVAWKIQAWVDEMSRYIKSIDKNHMVATGDEGYYCDIYQICGNVWCDCYYGVDTVNFTKSANIDFMSLHLYPDQWGTTPEWGNWWINNHTAIAHNVIGKPILLGEYGYKNNQDTVYESWTNSIYTNGTNGDLFWMISGIQDYGTDYWVPNYDGYAVYCPNASQPKPPGDIQSCPVLHKHAINMESNNN